MKDNMTAAESRRNERMVIKCGFTIGFPMSDFYMETRKTPAVYVWCLYDII